MTLKRLALGAAVFGLVVGCGTFRALGDGQYSGFPAYGDYHWRTPVATTAKLPTSGNFTGDVRLVLSPISAYYWSGSAWQTIVPPSTVSGAASSTDNAITRWDGTTGTAIQNSSSTLSDAGLLTTPNLILSGLTASTVPYLDASKQLTSSVVTPTQLGDLATATDANTASTIVKRDASGNFSAGKATLASNGLAVGTSELVVSGGLVGVATSSPIYPLQVGTYGTSTDSTLALASTTTGIGAIRFGDGTAGTPANAGRIVYDHSTDSMALSTAATERVRIDSSGNFGIGGTPTTKFELFGSLGNVQLPSTGNTITLTRNGANYITAAGASSTIAYSAANHNFYDNSTTTSRFYIDSSGTVGVGTTSPIYDLQVGTYGTDADSTLALASSATGTGSIRFGDGTGGTPANSGRIYYDHSTDSMMFWTAATERLKISSTGAVTIPGSLSVTGAITGNASTATALAANPSDCAANNMATAIDASGNLTCAQISDSYISSSAAISRSKIASGTANHVIINDGSGNLSSVAPSTAGNVLTSDGTAWTSAALTSSAEISNVGLTAAITSSTLVVALKQSDGSADCSATAPCKIGFRSSTATTGSYSQALVTSSASITLGTADSIGKTASVAGDVYVYYISDTTSELCMSAKSFDEGVVQSATALTAGADTSASTLYCANAHTSRPIRMLGVVSATWSNPNWGSITKVALKPFDDFYKNGNVTTETASQQRMEWFRSGNSDCASGNCSIIGTAGISSVSYNSTGSYTINFASGTFSGTPVCIVNAGRGGGRMCQLDIPATNCTSTSCKILCTVSSTAAANNADPHGICIGPTTR